LRQYKERRLDGYHGGKHMGQDLADALTNLEQEAAQQQEEEEAIDPYAPKVTKIKSFDLSKPISLEEAIFALDYIDHDFYVFRDDKTKEINVVYKRNAGGVGLIQPSE
jgi:putative sigma-54 modulation protein